MTITQPPGRVHPMRNPNKKKKWQEKGQVQGMINCAMDSVSGMNGHRGEKTFGIRIGIGKGFQNPIPTSNMNVKLRH